MEVFLLNMMVCEAHNHWGQPEYQDKQKLYNDNTDIEQYRK